MLKYLYHLSFFCRLTDQQQMLVKVRPHVLQVIDLLQVDTFFSLFIQDVLVRGATQWLSDVLKVRPLTKNVTFER